MLKAAPIEQAAVEHIRAGGDLCLICHIEEYVTRSYEALIQEAETRSQVCPAGSGIRRAGAGVQEEIIRSLKRRPPAPTAAKLERLSRQVWEFSEQVRLAQSGSGDRMIVAGIMSGTSADGINVALVRAQPVARAPPPASLRLIQPVFQIPGPRRVPVSRKPCARRSWRP